MGSLKAVNVQFALSDDLKSAADYMSAAISGVNKAVTNYETAYKAVRAEANGAKAIVATQTKLIATVEAKAKELGVNPSTIPGYNEANKMWSAANAAIDKANEL